MRRVIVLCALIAAGAGSLVAAAFQQAPAPIVIEVEKLKDNGRGNAKRTFKDTMTLGSGSDRIDLYYFGRGHTDGDAWVVFPSLGVVHAGDIFSG